MRRPWTHTLSAALTLAALLSTAPSAATGLCEGLQTTASLVAVSEAEQALVYEGRAEWCDEDRGVEGALRYAVVVGFDGTTRRHYFFAPENEDTIRAIDLYDPHLTFGFQPEYERLMAEGGFRPVQQVTPSPSGRCGPQVTTTIEEEPAANGDPAGRALVQLMIDGRPFESFSFRGVRIETEVRDKEPVVTSAALEAIPLYLPQGREVLLWMKATQCVGGPPGECYAADEIRFERMSVDAHPVLGACFEAPMDRLQGLPTRDGGCAGCATTPRAPWSGAGWSLVGLLLLARRRSRRAKAGAERSGGRR